MKPLIVILLLVSCAKTQPAAIPPAPKLGDTRYGGIIFYLNGEHGLIAAPQDQPANVWYSATQYFITTGATDTLNGSANTDLICNTFKGGTYAAEICKNLTVEGFSGWYLPSKTELNLLYKQKFLVGGFNQDNGYWTSTEQDSVRAWVQFFSNGFQVADNKFASYLIRAIKSF